MIKTLNNTIKQDRTAYKIPRSVQDVIPIQRIFADGIFQFGTKYSRTLRFSDINYAIASKEDKTAMFLGYSELLNALDSGSTTKLTICNKQVNRQAFEDTVLLPQRGDSLDGFVDEFNGMLEGKISGSSASVEQERFITVSVHKKNVDEARTFFSRVTGEVSSKLSRLNSSSNELDAAERLDVLRGFFRPEEAALPFDLQSAMRSGHNLKDTICPDSLEFHRDYFKMGNQYGRVLFLKDYASYIKDSMILELTDLNRRMMLSIDMIPVPTDEAVREVENKLLGVETNVTNWQRRQNSNQNFSAVVPYDLEQQRKETREMLDDFAYHSQLKADKAIKDGAFKDEIVPVVIKGKKGDTVFDTDEGPRLSAPEVLAKLKPAFTKDGIVTAANSSAINDGAAALVIMSEEKAKELGVEPLATWVAGALAGVEPEVMGLGPIAATKKVMAKTGLTVDDMDLIEANEAFAAQSVAVGQALHFDQAKLNVNGGAIALGHPVGASGARILVTLLYAMKHRGAHKGLATLCIGGGMGCATIVEM